MSPEQEAALFFTAFGGLVALLTAAAFLVVREDGPAPMTLMILGGAFGGSASCAVLGGLTFSGRFGLTLATALTLTGCVHAAGCDPFRSSAATAQARAEVPSDQLREASSRLLETKGN